MSGYGDREAFLSTVQERLDGGLPENPLRPIVGLGEPVPQIAYTADLSDRVAAFAEAAGALGARVHEHPQRDQLVRQVCRDHDARLAVVSADPECEGVATILVDQGVEVAPMGDLDAAAQADLGITGAACGIALTGSVVVDSSRAGGRLASLLPPVNLMFLQRDGILATPGDLWRRLPEHLPQGLPSNLVVITGPSRSTDIELQLTVGVHGPRELLLGLL